MAHDEGMNCCRLHDEARRFEPTVRQLESKLFFFIFVAIPLLSSWNKFIHEGNNHHVQYTNPFIFSHSS